MSYLSKTQSSDNGNIIWPGFVDVLASTLMVIIFIVLLFTVAQVYLGDLVVGKNEKIQSLEKTIVIQDETIVDQEKTIVIQDETIVEQDVTLSDKEIELIDRQNLIKKLDEEISIKQSQILAQDTIIQDQALDIDKLNTIIAKITDELSLSLADRKTLQQNLSELNKQQEILKSDLIKLGGENSELVGQIGESQNRIENLLESLSSSENINQELQNKLSTLEEESAIKSSDLNEALNLISNLALDIEILSNEINLLNNLLESKEAEIAQNQIELGELGDRLNRVLTSELFKLQKYKSEFFGKLSEALADRDDIQIKGDRFIFQSEILFDSGSANIQDEGRIALSLITKTIIEVAESIPSDLNWILQIDGHTDKIPISTSQFPSNWELSHARALEVVKFLIQQGIPANKLSANGYGEYQPINIGDTIEDLKENRRIELKITQK